jgi:hypothetical protein
MSAAAVLLIVLAACGGGSEPSDSPTTVVEPTPTFQVIEVTVAPTPTPTPSVPVATETPGDEQVLLELWNTAVEILVSQQWERTIEECTPEFRKGFSASPAEIEAGWRGWTDRFGYEFDKMTFGDPEVTVAGRTGIVKYKTFEDGEPIGWADTAMYTKAADDNWYRNCP